MLPTPSKPNAMCCYHVDVGPAQLIERPCVWASINEEAVTLETFHGRSRVRSHAASRQSCNRIAPRNKKPAHIPLAPCSHSTTRPGKIFRPLPEAAPARRGNGGCGPPRPASAHPAAAAAAAAAVHTDHLPGRPPARSPLPPAAAAGPAISHSGGGRLRPERRGGEGERWILS